MKTGVRRLLVLSGAMGLALSLGAPGTAQVAKTAEAHYATGLEHLQGGELQRAVAEFREALRANPNHAPTLMELADLLSQRGRAFEAYSLAQRAAAQAADSARLHLVFGRCYFYMRKFPKARLEFHRALELDPELSEPHFALAVIEAEHGRLAEAQQHVKSYIERADRGQLGQALEVMARISLNMKDYDSALSAYGALLKRNPNRRDIRLKIAQTLLAAERYLEAGKAYRALLEKDPEDKEALQGWFEASYERGAYQEAVEAMQRLARLDRYSCGPLLNLVRAYRRLNEFDQARQRAEQCLRIVPGHTQARYLLGRILFRQGEIEQAQRELQTVIQSNPGYAEALYWLATVELKLGQRSSAVAYLREAVSVNPDHVAARYALALELARQGNQEEARHQMEEFRRLKEREKWKSGSGDEGPSLMGAPGPGGPVSARRLDDWTNFAKYLVQEEKPRDALRILREAEAAAPDDPKVLRLIAVAYTEMGKVEEALAAYAEAEERAPSGLLFFGRGEVYFRLEETEAALADLRRAVSMELPPDKAAEAHLLLGSLLNKKKDFSGAEAELRRTLEIDPENAAARTLLAWVLVKLDRPGEAAAESRRVLNQHPQNASARLALVEALLAQGDAQEAGSEIALAAQLEGETGRILLARGKLAADRGMHALAIDYFKRAGELDPSQAEPFYLLGKELADRRRPGEAVQAFKKATILDGSHATSWVGLGKSYLAANRVEAAVECFREAIAAAPESGEAHYQLAVALERTSHYEEARQAALRARSLGHAEAEALLRSLNRQPR